MNDSIWNVDAPTYLNFDTLDDGKENAESYFEKHRHRTFKEVNFTPPFDKGRIDDEDNYEKHPMNTQNENIKNSDTRCRSKQRIQCKEQKQHRRSSSVPITKDDPVAELSTHLHDCKIFDEKSTVKLQNSLKYKSKDSLYDSNITIASRCNEKTKIKKFVSTAELIHQFERQTPERYHTVSSKADAKALLKDLANKTKCDKFVLPKTPKLLTKRRNRPITAIGFEMREEMELQKIKRYKIKARPLNKDTLHKRSVYPNVQRRPTTKPEPFKLTEVTRKPIAQITENFVFTAKPVPRHVIEGQGVKAKVLIKPPTVPVTPNVLKYKSKLPETLVSQKEDKGHSRSLLPKRTKIQPFSFDSRYKDAEKRKEQKLNQIIEEQNRAREFHSKPMPVFKTPVKATGPRIPVVPKSPKFASKELIVEKQQKFKLKIEEEERAKKQATVFKAKPCSVIYKKPFQPEMVDKVIEVEDFQLHSEIRAKDRQEFDAKLKLIEELRIEELRKKELLEKEKEAEETKKLRTKASFKAQPIRKFKTIISIDSKEPTVPESPMFASKYRTHIKKNE